MKVTVLGGGGFIGSHLVERLARDGHTVTAVDRAFPGLRRQWWQHATTRVIADLRVSQMMAAAVEGADMVFAMAADMGGVGYFHSEADQGAARNNMRLDLNLLDAVDCPVFYASSACCLPHTATVLHEGLLGGGPADQLYGEQKRMMTLLCAKDPRARVGIFHTIYGPGQEHDGPRAKFPPAICHKVKHAARHGGPVEIWGDGTQMRTFLYIDDAVDRIMAVAFADRYDGPVNIGSGEQVTVRECADWLCAHANIAPNYEFRADKPTGVLARGTDNTLFATRYGDLPLTPAAQGLARLYDWLP